MMVGQPAPEFVLRSLDSTERISLKELRGRPVVLNFWASWCIPCKYEHGNLVWASRRFKDDVVFLGIIHEDTEENAKRFLLENGHAYPQLIDPLSSTAVDYGLSGVPETYFIDANGVLRGRVAGAIDRGRLVANLQPLLPKAAAPQAGAQP
jgi:cytochrome c biogenesis protein CcmG/thiol:disulfide interchange protein DsbE